MKRAATRAALLLVAGPLVAAQTTPLQKVVTMLQTMANKALDDQQKEKVQFAAYKQFCDTSLAFKQQALAEGTQAMSMLQAQIQVEGATAGDAGSDAQDLDASIAGWTQAQQNATAARANENAAFVNLAQSYTDTISSIDQALQILRKQGATGQAVSLISQLEGAGAQQARAAVTAFLADYQSEGALDKQVPAKSQTAINLLEQLRAKFVDERAAAEKEELTRKHAYDLQQLGLKSSIDQANQQKSGKIQAKARDQQMAAAKAAQLADAQRTFDDNQKYVQDLNTTCQLKATDFATRQQTRANEISTIQKAIQLLAGPAVKSAKVKATSLLAIRIVDHHVEQERAAVYLKDQATRLDSPMLTALAMKAAQDPFVKVRQMIQDLISRLETEAGQETKHKAWCDQEIAANTEARASRNTSVSQLAIELDQLTSDIAKLNLDLSTLSQQQADNQKSVATQQSLRAAEKAQNAQTIQDAKNAEAAVAQAMILLREFYQTVGTSFLQEKIGDAAEAEERAAEMDGAADEDAPAVFSTPYQAQVSDGQAVISLLEVIQGDYARLESSTSASELSAQQAFEKLVDDSTTLGKQLTHNFEQKTTDKATKQQQVLDKTNDLKAGQKELAAANAYFEKLTPSCLASSDSLDQRKQRRNAEIQSLQEALRLLNGSS